MLQGGQEGRSDGRVVLRDDREAPVVASELLQERDDLVELGGVADDCAESTDQLVRWAAIDTGNICRTSGWDKNRWE